MAGKKTPVSKIHEITRLMELKLSDRAIARALKVSRNTVAAVREGQIGPESPAARPQEALRPDWTTQVDWDGVRSEFLAGTTLLTLWNEQVENGTVTVQYPAFWKHFSKRFPESKQSMHRIFSPGSRMEIDYCDGLDFFNPATGEVVSTQLFVGVLCHSRYAYAEFTLSQSSQDFLSSHVRMFEYFGGTTDVLSPDNLKSAVTKTHRYDPELNPAYTKIAQYYDIGVVPARVKTPKDKAIVERTIQIFQRWFYGTVRKRTFTSLVELNACLREHLEIFHAKKHRIFQRSRAEMFAEEKAHLRPLPENPYEVATHTTARLHPDCHLVFEKNHYSAPHNFRGQLLDLWASEKTVEIFFQGERIALHARRQGHGKFITQKSHYPEAHQAYSEATPSFVRSLAHKVGPHTGKLIDLLLTGETPLRHLRRAQGIVRLGKHYGHGALEEACRKALELNQTTFTFIERVLKNAPGGHSKTQRAQEKQDAKIARGTNPYLRGQELFH